ncbi:hypothetical protein [uncultured Shewanella sp.]|nr:hypothetical protein [uncultured Shewanella sp.]
MSQVPSKDVPFVDWMLDESWVLNQIGNILLRHSFFEYDRQQ